MTMPYKRSRARKQFEGEIRTILRTIDEAFSKRCSSPKVREYTLCSAVLLTSAKLESYIEDLIGDWGASIRTHGVTTERLPHRTRAYLLNHPTTFIAYRRYIADEDEGSFLTKIENSLDQAHYDFAFNGRPLPAFSVKLLYADRKYPSPKNIRRLFDRFGVANVFAELNRMARRDVEGLLTSFNDLRTELAHVGMPVGRSASDIKQRVKDVSLIVGYVDRMFYSAVRKSVGSNCWV